MKKDKNVNKGLVRYRGLEVDYITRLWLYSGNPKPL
jgi:hypothetical protein